jgi:hypothetical protein
MMSEDEYRRYAAESLALAQKTTNLDDRTRLLAMAQAWIALADKAKDEHKG